MYWSGDEIFNLNLDMISLQTNNNKIIKIISKLNYRKEELLIWQNGLKNFVLINNILLFLPLKYIFFAMKNLIEFKPFFTIIKF